MYSTITIIGGGVTGATLAIAIATMAKDKVVINIVENQKLHVSDMCSTFDTQFIALSYDTCQLLNKIGIWSKVFPYSTAVNKIEIKDCGYVGKVIITANEYQLPALGYVISLQDLKNNLFKLLYKISTIKLYSPAALKQVIRKKLDNDIILDNNHQFNSQLIVAADGSNSLLSSQCGIRFRQYSYQQIAISTNVSTSIIHQGHAFEYFTLYGPLAMLPAYNNYISLVWCISPKYHKEVIKWNEFQFCQNLQHIFGWKLGCIINSSKLRYHTLYLKIAERHISHRLALIGNAVQTLHPIAAQGCNLGIRDAIILAKIIAKTANQEKDIGEHSVLAEYQRKRKVDQAHIINVTDGLVHLFSNNNPSLIMTRNLGLLVIKYIPFLRNLLIKKFLNFIK